MKVKKYGHPYFGKVQYLLLVDQCIFFLLNRLNMVKIELLIPLSYFGIICTSSTETVKIADFVFFLSSDCSKHIER